PLDHRGRSGSGQCLLQRLHPGHQPRPGRDRLADPGGRGGMTLGLRTEEHGATRSCGGSLHPGGDLPHQTCCGRSTFVSSVTGSRGEGTFSVMLIGINVSCEGLGRAAPVSVISKVPSSKMAWTWS